MPFFTRTVRGLLALLALGSLADASAQPYGLETRSNMPAYFGTLPTTDPGGCQNNTAGQVPCNLSLTGAFSTLTPTTLTPHAGLVPYGLIQPLWSDGASKTRWVGLPFTEGAGTNPTVTFAPTGEWIFPTGTVFVKHFELVVNEQTGAKRRIETRIMVREPGGHVWGRSYRWDPALNGTDAIAVNSFGVFDNITITEADGVTTRQQRWDYPTASQCQQCHTQASGGVLGVKTRQQNSTYLYESTGIVDNQIRTWNHLGMFDQNVTDQTIAGLYRVYNIADNTRSLEDRVRSYVDANCSHCHRPSGGGPVWNGLFDTPILDQNIAGYPNAVNQRFNVPNSRMHVRDNQPSNLGGMPPLSKNVVDTAWINTLVAWINYPFDVASATSYGNNTKMRVAFTGLVNAASATLASNYAIDGGVTVQSAQLELDQKTVTLTTTPMSPNATYNVTVNRVKEFSTPFNPVWPNTSRAYMNAVPSTVLQFVQTAYSVSEGAGQVLVGVSRSGTSGAVSVGYRTADGAAMEGSDFTFTQGTLSWANGEGGTKFITIPITNDASAEPNEAFQVYLELPTGGAVIGANLTTTVTIVDNDGPPPVVSDLSGDGKSDLVLQNSDGRIVAWLMNGTTTTATANLIGAGAGWSVIRVADLDGDRKNDIFFQHTDGRIYVYQMNGLTVVGGKELFPAGLGWTISHTADLNDDGKADLILRHTDGRAHIWLMDGTAIIGSATLLPAGSGWNVVGVGDVNGDGRDDLIFMHDDGRGYIYVMNGTTITAGVGFLSVGSGWTVSHVADVNGDGKADLLFRHTDGRAHLFLMDGTTLGAGLSVLGAGTGWSISHMGDLNGDGRADIVFKHTDGRAHVRLMNGTAVVGAGDILPAATGWSVTQLYDFNGDGKKDLVFRNVNGSITVRLQDGLTILGSANLLGPGGWSVVPAQ
jgi:hypothetical protein